MVSYKDVNHECPSIVPQFTYRLSSDNIPEYNHIKSEEMFPLPIEWWRSSSSVRVIPYTVATEYHQGHYNTTFTWESIERVLRIIEKYKAVSYKRVTRGARLTFLQSNKDLGRGVAAVATKSKGLIRINPTFNFGRNLSYCDRIIFHENLHLTGSTKHTPPGDPRPLMHMYGGNHDSLLPIDETYITVYPWIGSERFSTTPNILSNIQVDPLARREKVVCGIEWSWRDMLVYP
jgi:hypothetical protein